MTEAPPITETELEEIEKEVRGLRLDSGYWSGNVERLLAALRSARAERDEARGECWRIVALTQAARRWSRRWKAAAKAHGPATWVNSPDRRLLAESLALRKAVDAGIAWLEAVESGPVPAIHVAREAFRAAVGKKEGET